MNSCAYYQELISRLVDGELNRDEYEALMAHMSTCSCCNAMYAIFHDLSDLIDEEAEPLPAGLHENIMAGVRRSAVEKQNRRRAGLVRNVLAAAACAVLVLFAAKGLAPADRAEQSVIQTRAEAERLLPSASAPTEAAPAVPEAAAQPETVQATPAPTQSPAPEAGVLPATAAPIRTSAPAAAGQDPYLSTPTPETNTARQQAAPATRSPEPQPTPGLPERTESPAATEAPSAAVTTSAPAPVIEASPAADSTAQASPAVEERAARVLETPAAAAVTEMPAASSAPAPAAQTAAPEVEAEKPAPFFRSFRAMFRAAPAVTEPEADEPVNDGLRGTPEPEPKETAAADKSDREKSCVVEVRSDKLYGKLMELLAGTEEKLPEDEAVETVRIRYFPEDVYATGQKLSIRIYDDFVCYVTEPTEGEGGSRSFRAKCSPAELEELLDMLRAAQQAQAAASPSPCPSCPATESPDPYAAEEPMLLGDAGE